VKSGKFTNITPGATKIIEPEIATPKLKISTILTHPAVVSTPVLLGNKKEVHEVTRVNAVTGEVVGKSQIIVDRPIVGEVKQVMNVDTHHE